MRWYLLVFFVLIVGAATAVPVDPYSADGIAAVFFEHNDNMENYNIILCVDGSIKRLVRGGLASPPFIWQDEPDYPTPPVPITEISDWTPQHVLTISGERWFYQTYERVWYSMNDSSAFTDLNCGELPVSNQSESMDGFKSRFR